MYSGKNNNKIEMNKLLVVGQTPPPYGGQAIMIKYMLDNFQYKKPIKHVRMCFSKEFNDRGKFSLYKITHLIQIIYQIWIYRFKYKCNTLYYPISSSPKVAVLRDAVILGLSRFLFKKIIYHFHAAGISEELPKYNLFIRNIVYGIMKKPDLAITSSEYNPKDAEYLKAKRKMIIPLGIPDENMEEKREYFNENKPLNLLFVGLLNSTKGEGYLLDAINILKLQGIEVQLKIAGKFESDTYKDLFFSQIKKYGLENNFEYKGIVTGKEKEKLFLESDVLCFPSFFASESFGIVLLEAMMYQMPIIATRWRGIQSIVDHNNNGYLVDIKDSNSLAKEIEKLHNDRSLLKEMAKCSRIAFKKKYELSVYIYNMEKAIFNL